VERIEELAFSVELAAIGDIQIVNAHNLERIEQNSAMEELKNT
jgi:hypothetical protein